MFVWKKGRSSILVNSTFESEPTLWIVLYGPVSYLPRHRVKMGLVVLVPNYRQGCLCSTQINDSTVNPPDNPFLMRQWRGKNCACTALYPKSNDLSHQVQVLLARQPFQPLRILVRPARPPAFNKWLQHLSYACAERRSYKWTWEGNTTGNQSMLLCPPNMTKRVLRHVTV